MVKDILWKDEVFTFHVSSIAICYNLVVIVHELEPNALRNRRLQINQNLLIYFKAVQKWTLVWFYHFIFTSFLSFLFIPLLMGYNWWQWKQLPFKLFFIFHSMWSQIELIQFDALFAVGKNSDILRMKSILLISCH